MNTSSSPTLAAPKRVLVIDDNADAAESIEQLLMLDGHDVRTAGTGRAGVATAESFAPHLVLLDIGLPDIDGYEVARQIRAAPWGAALYLVAVTGWSQQKDRDAALAAGFNLHLAKPVDPTHLDKLLRDLG